MALPVPPADLPGSPESYQVMKGVGRRLHNRRIGMIVTPDGDFQLQIAKLLAPGEADELRRIGHRNTIDDFIIRDRVRYSVVSLSAEAFEAAVWCWERLKARRQRKR